jgi:hypothetical protein
MVIQVVVLTRHQDLAPLVREAVASGAHAPAATGGDGSLGPVAAIHTEMRAMTAQTSILSTMLGGRPGE